MNFKKPKFWDYKYPSILAYLLLPIAIFINFLNSLRQPNKNNFKIKTICVGNIYVGGTGKTSLSIKLYNLFNERNIKSCFIKKFYRNQIDEQKLLEKKGKIFISKKRFDAIKEAESNKYQVAILDDGLQDKSIKCDINLVCFNNINWIGNGMTIPSGPLRENINNLKNYNHIFLNGNLENLETLKKSIYKINPNITIHLGKYKPTNLDEFDKTDKYIVFSGIGNHQTFIQMLKNYDFKVIKDLEYPDHYKFKENDIKFILEKANNLKCKIITTEKDYFRINKNYQNRIKFVKSELKIVDEDKLIKILN